MSDSTSPPFRLWPAVLIVGGMWGLTHGVTRIPDLNVMMAFMLMMWAPFLAALGMCGWYAFFSKRPWGEALAIPGAFIALGAGSVALSHPSFMGFGHLLYGLPVAVSAWFGALVLTGWMSWPWRRTAMLFVFALVWGGCTALAMDGVWGDFSPQLRFRWQETSEDKLNKEQPPAPTAPTVKEKVVAGPTDWTGFRGPNRDSVLTGFQLGTDWQADAPKELWKQRIGPGWGAFTVVGDRAFTQHQRTKDDEAVVCLDANTGKEIWAYTDPVRFNETVAGPGPRTTPTFADGRIYAFGAKGLLNCLDASTGERLWQRDAAKEAGADVPTWGFSASPLVAHGIVTVYVGGPKGQSVLAYDALTGEPRWTAPAGGDSYASTQLMTFSGFEALVVTTGHGLTLLEPKTGKVLMDYSWKIADGMNRCTQPVQVGPMDVVFGTGFGAGTKRLKLTAASDGTVSAEEVWHTKKFNPYYNDHVVYQGHLYGMSGDSVVTMACLDLETGEEKWRTRGYDAGQVLLLADQGLLLVTSEKGKVALVRANPEKHVRVTQMDAIEGKTWNHPAIAGGRLFVRNGEWAAAFRLPAAK